MVQVVLAHSGGFKRVPAVLCYGLFCLQSAGNVLQSAGELLQSAGIVLHSAGNELHSAGRFLHVLMLLILLLSQSGF